MSPSPYSLAVEITAVLTLWVALSVWQRDRRTSTGTWFLGLALAVLLWCVGELASGWGFVDQLARDRLTFAGILTVPPLWLAVGAHAAGLSLARRIPWFPVALLVPSAVLYALLYLGPWSNLFLIEDGSVAVEGPLFPIWTAYAYALVLAGIALFAVAATRWPRRGLWARVGALAVGVLIPLAGNALYVFAGLDWGHAPTPVLIGLAVIPLRAALFGSGFLDVLPVDQRNILHEIPVGIVIADDAGGVVQLNPAAESTLGTTQRQALGRSLDAVLATLPTGIPVRVVPLTGRFGSAQCAVLGGLPEAEAPPLRVAAR